MGADFDACIKEICQFYIINRRKITSPELLPIFQRYFNGEKDIRSFLKFLQSEIGKAQFIALFRETCNSSRLG